jgi:hypothetical protein
MFKEKQSNKRHMSHDLSRKGGRTDLASSRQHFLQSSILLLAIVGLYCFRTGA